MAFVHEDSCPCAKSELDLFCLPPTQTSILKYRSIEYSPISILGNGPVEFAVSGSGEDYTDLANTYLHVICKVLHSDGSKLKEERNIDPVNNLLHSMWSQVDLYLNDMLITPSTNTYPYRAYLETLLSFDESVKRNRLRSALWDDDWRGTRDDYDRNSGHIRRKSCVRGSQPVELYGRLHLDLFMQERFLVNGVDMKLKLSRSKPEFVLMGDSADYQIKLEQVHLDVRKVTLNPAVLLAHAKVLDKTPAKYPVQRVEMKTYAVTEGGLTANRQNVFMGQIPKRIIVGMVRSDSFNGEVKRNPFYFEHNSIDFIALHVNGEQFPSKAFKPDFNWGLFMRDYHSVFTDTNMDGDQSNNISREDYKLGSTLFAFDLTPDQGDSGHFNLIRTGNVDEEIHFGRASTSNQNVILYAQFDNVAGGFWQIPLDEDSQLLTTFITPFGRYAFPRLPFGISSAPEIFQKKMSALLDGLSGVEVIMDDILVCGRTIEEHDARLEIVIRIINDSGLKLNTKKCTFRKHELT